MDTNILRQRSYPEKVPARTDETPHACYEGWVCLGFEGAASEQGEHVEIIERVPCRKCSAEGL